MNSSLWQQIFKNDYKRLFELIYREEDKMEAGNKLWKLLHNHTSGKMTNKSLVCEQTIKFVLVEITQFRTNNVDINAWLKRY